jgi:hypothetical protein
MVFLQVEIDGFFVVVGVDVAEPGVHGIAAGGKFEFRDSLAKGAIGDAVLGAEFHHGAGMKHFGERHGEGDVFGPAGFFVHSLGKAVEELPIERIELGAHVSILHEMRLQQIDRI